MAVNTTTPKEKIAQINHESVVLANYTKQHKEKERLGKKDIGPQKLNTFTLKTKEIKEDMVLVMDDRQQNTKIDEGDQSNAVSSDFLTIDPQNNKQKIDINPNFLLSLAEAKIAEKKAVDFHKEIKMKYGITPKTLLVKAEDLAAQTFMSKVWRTIQDKSTPVFTAVANRNQK
ncbi:MAG: hypothetical protein IPO92_12390 [Saprospiraceae bacterium]|nr:hypothetical protein [Saprospiraceae bacterium]